MVQKKAHPEKDDNDGKQVQRDEDITKTLHTPNQLTRWEFVYTFKFLLHIFVNDAHATF